MANSLWTMPIIILNMGGEMIYILHQRLQAQTVQDEKAKKVLGDVVRAMFSAQFIAELFKPQEMYSSVSTKQIFGTPFSIFQMTFIYIFIFIPFLQQCRKAGTFVNHALKQV